MTHILGITHPISANTAAALVKDGCPIAMAEEERFLKIKHAPFKLPLDAIDYCLGEGDVLLQNIDAIAVGFSRVNRIFLERLQQLSRAGKFKQLPNLYLRWMRWKTLEQKIDRLRAYGIPIIFVRHHYAHIASSVFMSGFKQSIFLSLDGSGGEESGLLGFSTENNVRVLARLSDDHSLGMAWEMVTDHLGLRPHSDEGQVMGLAGYGVADQKDLPFVSWDYPIPRIQRAKLENYLEQIPRRIPGEEFLETHNDLAATIQQVTTQVVSNCVEYAYKKTGISTVCLSGGVLLNCVANGAIAQLPFVDDLFVQPASHDAGTALGAALHVSSSEWGSNNETRQKHSYFGPLYSNGTVESILQEIGVERYRRIDNYEHIADLLSSGKIVAWFQGRMEFGPRALGARSILADPRSTAIRDRVNQVKGRAPWRPLSPSILEEALEDFVVGRVVRSPFMIIAYQASDTAKQVIPGTIHVDNTLRPQAVCKHTNQRFWELISEFKNKTGVPALLNTSFNLAGEPIVLTPKDAVGSFFRSGIDYLVIEDFLLWK